MIDQRFAGWLDPKETSSVAGYCFECGTVLPKGPPCAVCKAPTCTGCTTGDTCVACVGVCPRCGADGYDARSPCRVCVEAQRYKGPVVFCTVCGDAANVDHTGKPTHPKLCPQCEGPTCFKCLRVPIEGEPQPCLTCKPLDLVERAERDAARIRLGLPV